MDGISAMRASHNRSEAQADIIECNRKQGYFWVLFVFLIKVMFGTLSTFGILK